MGRTSIEELRNRRVNAMTSAERAQFDEALATARLAIDVGEKVREAREAAGLSQRELAVRMSTSQAAVARLEAGGTSATLTTLQKAAAALGLELTIDLAPRTLTTLSVSCPEVAPPSPNGKHRAALSADPNTATTTAAAASTSAPSAPLCHHRGTGSSAW